MPNCMHRFEEISALVDNALSAGEREALLLHISECADCAALYETYQRLSGLDIGGEAEPPAELLAGVMAKVAAQSVPPVKKRGILRLHPLRIAAYAACAVLILYSGLYFSGALFRGGGEMAPASQTAGLKMYTEGAECSASLDAAAPEAAPPANKAEEGALYASGGGEADNIGGEDVREQQTVADALPEPSAAAAPGEAEAPPPAGSDSAAMQGIQDTLSWYARIEIDGALPAALAGLPQTDLGDGTVEIRISRALADELGEAGYALQPGAEGADTALVIYRAG